MSEVFTATITIRLTDTNHQKWAREELIGGIHRRIASELAGETVFQGVKYLQGKKLGCSVVTVTDHNGVPGWNGSVEFGGRQDR